MGCCAECYYEGGCSKFAQTINPTGTLLISPPNCFSCRLIDENIKCPPNWRIVKCNGKYIIQKKRHFIFFSIWLSIKRFGYECTYVATFGTAYEAYEEIDKCNKIDMINKDFKEKWKKENGIIVCGDK